MGPKNLILMCLFLLVDKLTKRSGTFEGGAFDELQCGRGVDYVARRSFLDHDIIRIVRHAYVRQDTVCDERA